MHKEEAIPLELVREFVSAAHLDLERVVELLALEPGLVNAAMNWGGGDWETALGAAAHVGRRDIAEYLLSRGARMDLFAAAMLGHLDIVQSMIEKYPFMAHARGPHGIPLIRHAMVGGPPAEKVVAYLESLIHERSGLP